jgi:ABC-type antimicrobial peptide transport system permease subunit
MSFVTNFNSFYNYFPTLTKFGYFYIFVVTIKTPSSFHVNDIYEYFHQ